MARAVERGSPDDHDGARIPIPSYQNLLPNIIIISNQVACVFIVFIIYMNLRDHSSHTELITRLVLLSSFLLVFGTVISKVDYKKAFRAYAVVFMFTFALTPVVKTLTASISGNTILRLQVLLLFLHLVSLDYFSRKNQSIFSANCVTLAVICMVSRFDKDEIGDNAYFRTFGLIIFTIQMLIIWPVLRIRLEQKVMFWLIAILDVCCFFLAFRQNLVTFSL